MGFGFNIWFWFTRQEPIVFFQYNSLISKHVRIRIPSPVPLEKFCSEWGAKSAPAGTVAARCRRGPGMGGQDGLRADADVR